jgi:hypothetical protein
MLRAAVIVLLIALIPSHARAEARIALLIGNEAYPSEIGRLANPHDDVALLALPSPRSASSALLAGAGSSTWRTTPPLPVIDSTLTTRLSTAGVRSRRGLCSMSSGHAWQSAVWSFIQ